MVNRVVGRLFPYLNYDLLCKEIVKGGMTMVTQRYMGDNRVMITPKNEEMIEDIVLSKCLFIFFKNIVDVSYN